MTLPDSVKEEEIGAGKIDQSREYERKSDEWRECRARAMRKVEGWLGQ